MKMPRVIILGLLLCLLIFLYFQKPAILSKKVKSLAKPTGKATILQLMQITSNSFKNNQQMPQKFSCQGEGINPQLSFNGVPKLAKTLVLIMDDPDAPNGTFVHWIIYNIPPQTSEIKENGVPEGASFGLNSLGKSNYTPACPPSGIHRYYFKLYALDTNLSFNKAPNKSAIEMAMQNHTLSSASLIGLFGKK